jgi:hypothetical protein
VVCWLWETPDDHDGGALRRLYPTQHPCSCGIARHARTMSVCIRTQRGAVLGQRHMQTRPDPFLPVMAPSRQGMVVAVACRCPWDWLADRWADAGSPFVLGQALSMQALPGGTAKTDPRDSHKRAAVRHGGTLPQADGSAAAVVFLRAHPAAPTDRTRVEKTPDQGTAGTRLAQQVARAVSHRRQRHTAGEPETFCPSSGRGTDAPAASLDPTGAYAVS